MKKKKSKIEQNKNYCSGQIDLLNSVLTTYEQNC